jgi:sortase A
MVCKRLGKICVAVGTLLILSAVILIVHNVNEDKNAEKASNVILPELKTSIETRIETDNSEISASNPDDTFEDTDDTSTSTDMSIVEIDGYGYIGYLTVPALNMSLPIMAEWDYTRLKIAPCRQFGTAAGNDLVIAGHNYTSNFGNLKTLQVGDAVYFTDVDGKVISYEVSATEILQPTQVEEMRNSSWDLTLYTCTYGGRERVTIRCKQVQQTAR